MRDSDMGSIVPEVAVENCALPLPYPFPSDTIDTSLGEGPQNIYIGGIMVERLMPDFGLDTLPLAITSPGRKWPGPGPGEMAPSGLVPGAPPHIL